MEVWSLAGNTPHTAVGLADMPEGQPQRSHSATALLGSPEIQNAFPCELVGGIGAQPVVNIDCLSDLFDEDSRNVGESFPGPSNGFDIDVLCVQLEEDSFEDSAHHGVKAVKGLWG